VLRSPVAKSTTRANGLFRWAPKKGSAGSRTSKLSGTIKKSALPSASVSTSMPTSATKSPLGVTQSAAVARPK
jgi:hypothetical protein